MKEERDTTTRTVKRPNFIVIGAAKSGTTALWNYFRQHPQIYMSPKKHTRFFSFQTANPVFRGPGPINDQYISYAIADAATYHALFVGAEEETAIGEASHSYLYVPEAAGRIKSYAPDVRLIAILRNPVERAFSHYSQMVRDGREPSENFFEALKEEAARIEEGWWPDFHYTRMGLYYDQLRRYFDLFERDQIKVYLYDDFRADPVQVLRDAFEFLDVDSTFVPDTSIRYNASGVAKNKTLHLTLQGLRRARPIIKRLVPEKHYRGLLRVGGGLHNKNLTEPRLSAEARGRMTAEYFREDIIKLEDLIERDLSTWLR
ncbi:sulfotransferase [Rubrobacter tropicus]|uniref:Sulfotransferase n=1 Tax=Rubrobacter tropicus TaxID=2653851 RepID=A0A6G8QD57_9ACTN|nr:sulfotransferase [Rubrobacter tropicus]QIN84368.1 sulfotransferase [Rubrobacter tropicus]